MERGEEGGGVKKCRMFNQFVAVFYLTSFASTDRPCTCFALTTCSLTWDWAGDNTQFSLNTLYAYIVEIRGIKKVVGLGKLRSRIDLGFRELEKEEEFSH